MPSTSDTRKLYKCYSEDGSLPFSTFSFARDSQRKQEYKVGRVHYRGKNGKVIKVSLHDSAATC